LPNECIGKPNVLRGARKLKKKTKNKKKQETLLFHMIPKKEKKKEKWICHSERPESFSSSWEV
jgi:hypothetical protein